MKKLAILFIIVFLSYQMFAQQLDSDIFTYKVKYEQITISAVNEPEIAEINIPEYIDDRPVLIIGREAFQKCKNLKKVVLPDGLIRIESYAFAECPMLQEIVIPDSVIYIGEGAFSNCYSLKKIVLSRNLISIQSDTFANCRQLTDININNSITDIQENAFCNCKSLKKITIPNTIINISPMAFEGCDIIIETSDLQFDNRDYQFSAFVQVISDNVIITTSDSTGTFQNNRSRTVGAYQLAKYPVTQQLFEAIMGYNPSKFSDEKDLASDELGLYRPVESVSWYEAIAFCNKLSLRMGLLPCYDVAGINDWNVLTVKDIPPSQDSTWDNVDFNYANNGYRLPTETEWEFAARGGRISDESVWNNPFLGVKNLDEIGWFDSKNVGTHQVGLKNPNTLNLYDMFGNVMQWCFDGFTSFNAKHRINCAYGGFDSKVVRGSGWNTPADKDIFKYRNSENSYVAKDNIGIRLARTVTQSSLSTVTFCDGYDRNVEFVRYGERIKPLAVSKKDNVAFVGWFFDYDCDRLFDFNSFITHDITIYGKWVRLNQKMNAPEMVTIIKKNDSVEINGDTSEDKIILNAYQMSKKTVNRESFTAIMGYDPADETGDSQNCVSNVTYLQAIAFCNKLSLRVGRKIVYQVDGIDDWSRLPYCDIPLDDSWSVIVDLDANGYRLPTDEEINYALETFSSDLDFSLDTYSLKNGFVLARSVR